MLKRKAYSLFVFFLANAYFSAFPMETDLPDVAFTISDPLLYAIEHEPIQAYRILQQNTQVSLEHIQKAINTFKSSLHAEILSLLLRNARLPSSQLNTLIQSTNNSRAQRILLLYSEQDTLQKEFETKESLLEEAIQWDVLQVIQDEVPALTQEEKNTYLCLAAYSQAEAVTRLLLKHGADANWLKNKQNSSSTSQTPLSQALDSLRLFFNPQVIELLLRYGASPISLEDVACRAGLLDVKSAQEQEKWKMVTCLMLTYGGNANPAPSLENKLFKRRSSYNKQSEKAKLITYLFNEPSSKPSPALYTLINKKNEIFCWLLESLFVLGSYKQAKTLVQTAKSCLPLSNFNCDQFATQAQHTPSTIKQFILLLFTQPLEEPLDLKVSSLEELQLLIQPMLELAAGQAHEEILVFLLCSSQNTPMALAHIDTVLARVESIIKRIEKEKSSAVLTSLEADNLISRYKRIQDILTNCK